MNESSTPEYYFGLLQAAISQRISDLKLQEQCAERSAALAEKAARDAAEKGVEADKQGAINKRLGLALLDRESELKRQQNEFQERKGKWEAQKIGELEMLQRRSDALEQKQTSIDAQQSSLQAQKEELEQRLDDLQNAGDFLKGLLDDLNSQPSYSKKHRRNEQSKDFLDEAKKAKVDEVFNKGLSPDHVPDFLPVETEDDQAMAGGTDHNHRETTAPCKTNGVSHARSYQGQGNNPVQATVKQERFHTSASTPGHGIPNTASEQGGMEDQAQPSSGSGQGHENDSYCGSRPSPEIDGFVDDEVPCREANSQANARYASQRPEDYAQEENFIRLEPDVRTPKRENIATSPMATARKSPEWAKDPTVKPDMKDSPAPRSAAHGWSESSADDSDPDDLIPLAKRQMNFSQHRDGLTPGQAHPSPKPKDSTRPDQHSASAEEAPSVPKSQKKATWEDILRRSASPSPSKIRPPARPASQGSTRSTPTRSNPRMSFVAKAAATRAKVLQQRPYPLARSSNTEGSNQEPEDFISLDARTNDEPASEGQLAACQVPQRNNGSNAAPRPDSAEFWDQNLEYPRHSAAEPERQQHTHANNSDTRHHPEVLPGPPPRDPRRRENYPVWQTETNRVDTSKRFAAPRQHWDARSEWNKTYSQPQRPHSRQPSHHGKDTERSPFVSQSQGSWQRSSNRDAKGCGPQHHPPPVGWNKGLPARGKAFARGRGRPPTLADPAAQPKGGLDKAVQELRAMFNDGSAPAETSS